MYPLTSLCDPLSFWNREKPFYALQSWAFSFMPHEWKSFDDETNFVSCFFLNTPSRHSLLSNWECETLSHTFPVPGRTRHSLYHHVAFLSEWTHTESETLTWLCAAHVTSWGGGDVGGGLELVKVSRRSQAFRPIADQTIGCSLSVWCLLLSASVCTCAWHHSAWLGRWKICHIVREIVVRSLSLLSFQQKAGITL